ncbi:MAG: NnrU family protein, partial [Gammaproteobacteria bacterium]|nr:NnrU family protein [Gammaproteobacteria bacterium]
MTLTTAEAKPDVTTFLAGLAVFLGVHSISVFNRQWRDAMVRNLGELPWKGLYSVASLAG